MRHGSSAAESDGSDRAAGGVLTDALVDTRVALVNGARQVGNSTLVATACRDRDAEWRSLDRPLEREAARADPIEFVRVDVTMVIDEIQRRTRERHAFLDDVDGEGRRGACGQHAQRVGCG